MTSTEHTARLEGHIVSAPNETTARRHLFDALRDACGGGKWDASVGARRTSVSKDVVVAHMDAAAERENVDAVLVFDGEKIDLHGAPENRVERVFARYGVSVAYNPADDDYAAVIVRPVFGSTDASAGDEDLPDVGGEVVALVRGAVKRVPWGRVRGDDAFSLGYSTTAQRGREVFEAVCGVLAAA